MGGIREQVQEVTGGRSEPDWLDHVARIGLVAYGIVHLTIAWLALQLALGDKEGSASSEGAVHELAQQPFGAALVWAVAVGMLALVVWRGLEAAFGHRDEDGATRVRKRVASGAKAVVYALIGYTAVMVALGSGSSGGGGTDSMTKTVMDLPAGQALVVAAGLALLGVGAYYCYVGCSAKLPEKLDAEGQSGNSGTAYVWFGRVGYVAKGIAIGIVGALFAYAGVTHDPKKSGGLDQALTQLLEQPFGPVLVFAVGVGLGCYGVFCLARARHLSR